MVVCKACGKQEDLALPFIDGVCYECTRIAEGTTASSYEPTSRRQPERHVAFRVFQSSCMSWREMFQEAAEFASHFDQNDLISISHSHEGQRGTVTVWFWISPQRSGQDDNSRA